MSLIPYLEQADNCERRLRHLPVGVEQIAPNSNATPFNPPTSAEIIAAAGVGSGPRAARAKSWAAHALSQIGDEAGAQAMAFAAEQAARGG